MHLGPTAHQMEKREVETFLGNLNRDIRAANSLMQSIRSAIRGLQRWIADLNEKKQLLLDALEKAKEPTLSDLLVDYFNLRNEQRRRCYYAASDPHYFCSEPSQDPYQPLHLKDGDC